MRTSHTITRAVAIASTIAASATLAQPVEPTNGPRKVLPGWHALTGATVTTAPSATIEDATIVIRNGAIIDVGANVSPPDGARVWDLDGLHITPAFVEPYFEVEAPAPEAHGAHWNSMVTPQRSALDGGGIGESNAKSLRSMGFAVANIAPEDGIFRGRTAVVSLSAGDDDSSQEGVVLNGSLFHAAALDRTRGYPGSQMGAIALARQTLADTGWHARAREMAMSDPTNHDRPEDNAALQALGDDAPILWDVDNELEALRAIRLSKEFDRTPIVVGSGTEFRRLGAIRDSGVRLIVPLTYPRKPNVTSMAARHDVSLRELMTWEQAPTNAWRLTEAGVEYAFTSAKRRKGEKLFNNVRNAIDHGLSEEDALRAMTTAPAAMLGVDDLVGTIEPGKLANLIVSDKPIFEEGAEIRDLWVDGIRHTINDAPAPTFEGEYLIEGDPDLYIKITEKNRVSVVDARGHEDESDEEHDEKESEPRTFKARHTDFSENRLSFDIDSQLILVDGATIMVDATIEGDTMHGRTVYPDGESLDWTATKREDEDEADEETEMAEDEDETVEDLDVPYDLPTPLGGFGYTRMPFQDSTIVINATIWTCGPEGIIEDGWLISDDEGKITYVGPSQGEVPNDINILIDAEGKHVTPGLIDCHSHTGISGGVNEGTQAVTSEVRIADVIDPDAIGWYRQLAGGITAVNQLHGSANPIGGQNSVVKLRWGADHPDDMRLDGAIGGIKFALGENVKQSNWGRGANTRYPQTRMGVETIMRDRFVAAREYHNDWMAYNNLSDREKRTALPPRRDLELEAIAEILNDERLIHCHSYRQDEILMLCRLAEEFGFTIGTFQHVLEGYKVAEAIKEHAIGGSSFSDWWAYKFEVFDAIPQNGAIMHDVGVVVSFNSDSNELARRMNAEAAKAVKYGGVPEEEALKFVTLNPAKQLKIDDRVGSLETGKDADFVVWNAHPLSAMARPTHTIIEGRMFFSLAKDRELREIASAERQRIIQKILTPEDKDDDARTGEREDEQADDEAVDIPGDPDRDATPEQDPDRRYSMMQRMTSGGFTREALEREYLWMIQNGLDPDVARCGDCGCSIHSLFKRR